MILQLARFTKTQLIACTKLKSDSSSRRSKLYLSSNSDRNEKKYGAFPKPSYDGERMGSFIANLKSFCQCHVHHHTATFSDHHYSVSCYHYMAAVARTCQFYNCSEGIILFRGSKVKYDTEICTFQRGGAEQPNQRKVFLKTLLLIAEHIPAYYKQTSNNKKDGAGMFSQQDDILTSIRMLALIQHYTNILNNTLNGNYIGTPMLDCTRDLRVAASFATNSHPMEQGVVRLLLIPPPTAVNTKDGETQEPWGETHFGAYVQRLGNTNMLLIDLTTILPGSALRPLNQAGYMIVYEADLINFHKLRLSRIQLDASVVNDDEKWNVYLQSLNDTEIRNALHSLVHDSEKWDALNWNVVDLKIRHDVAKDGFFHDVKGDRFLDEFPEMENSFPRISNAQLYPEWDPMKDDMIQIASNVRDEIVSSNSALHNGRLSAMTTTGTNDEKYGAFPRPFYDAERMRSAKLKSFSQCHEKSHTATFFDRHCIVSCYHYMAAVARTCQFNNCSKGMILFRGSKVNYEAEICTFRRGEADHPNQRKLFLKTILMIAEHLPAYYESTYNNTKDGAGMFSQQDPIRTSIRILALIQHYQTEVNDTLNGNDQIKKRQIATPMLDCTRDLRVAATFATNNMKEQGVVRLLLVPPPTAVNTKDGETLEPWRESHFGAYVQRLGNTNMLLIDLTTILPGSALRPLNQAGYLIVYEADLINFHKLRLSGVQLDTSVVDNDEKWNEYFQSKDTETREALHALVNDDDKWDVLNWNVVDLQILHQVALDDFFHDMIGDRFPGQSLFKMENPFPRISNAHLYPERDPMKDGMIKIASNVREEIVTGKKRKVTDLYPKRV